MSRAARRATYRPVPLWDRLPTAVRYAVYILACASGAALGYALGLTVKAALETGWMT